MAHLHYDIDITVEVFVVKGDRVLLRKHDKYGIWLSVGGHVEMGEDPNSAALREVKEEVGLDVELISLDGLLDTNLDIYTHLVAPVFMNKHKINDTHSHVTMVYFAKFKDGEIKQGENEVSDGVGWFSAEELDSLDNINDTVREYAKAAIREVSRVV